MSASVREYAILYTGARPASGSSAAALGGSVVLDAAPHPLGGAEHTGPLDIARLVTTSTDVAQVARSDGAGGLVMSSIPVLTLTSEYIAVGGTPEVLPLIAPPLGLARVYLNGVRLNIEDSSVTDAALSVNTTAGDWVQADYEVLS